MTRNLADQPLTTLEQSFQALEDQAARLPAACREELQTAFQEVSQAIAALRGAREAELSLLVGTPGEPPVQEDPGRANTILGDVFNAIPDLLTIHDLSYHIIMSNWHGDVPAPPAAERSGRLKCYEVYLHLNQPCDQCQLRTVVATGRPQKIVKYNPVDHRIREINAFPIRDETGRVVLVAEHVRDITENHLADKALKASEERFRAIFETADDAIFIKDPSFRYIQVNPAMARFHGKSADQIIGLTEKDLFGADAAHIRQQDRKVLAGEVIKSIVTLPVQGVPTTFHVVKVPLHDDAGQIVGLCGIARDITEVKQAAEALRQKEERLAGMVDAITDHVSMMDRDYNILWANPVAQRVFGQDLVGKKCYQAYHRQEKPCENCNVSQVFQDGQIHDQETEAIGADGQTKYFWSTASVAGRDADGTPRLVVEVSRDITQRKQAAEVLKESEERFRHISSTISDISYSCTAAPDGSYAIDWLAGAAESITGYSLEEIKAHRCWRFLVIEADLPLFEKYVSGLPVGSSAACELRLRHKEGEIVWVDSFAEVVKQQGPPELIRIYGGLVDITARKRAEEALRQSEERFRDTTENAAEWVWEVDHQGKYTYSSPVVEQLLGYKPEEVLGKYFYDFFLPEEREELKRAALQAFAAKQPFRDFLNRNLHKNGQTVWLSTGGIPILDNQGNLLGYRGADIDVTARREAEELSLNLIAKSPVGIYLIQNGKFKQVNQLIFAITGYSQDDFGDQPPLQFVHPEDRQATRENAVNMLKGLSSIPYEFRITTKDGKTKWIMETMASIPYQGERAALGYCMDITEHKQLEAQLLQAQKMEAVGRLAGGVAHDFNNLLMAISGYGELMRSNVVEGDPLYEYLENILKAGQQAAALTHQLLTFSRRQIVRPQKLDLKQVVLDLEPMLRRLIGEDIDLEIFTEPEPAAVKADPGHLSQIIMNLVLNARDAMPRGGRLLLKTTPVNIKKSHPTRFGPIPPGPYAMLLVQDTGAGMAEDLQAHIFEPFFTTKEPGKGTGLGLSTVYGIVKQSGGYLDLDSKLGGGSTFTIYLPRLKKMAEPAKARIPITTSFRGNETILLVEDEDVLRGLLAKFLRLHGYTVLEARHGGEALLTCERHQGPIHLMVTDVVMPQMSGRELADRLAPLRRDMKVLYMSGYTEDAMVQYDVADLSVPFLQKPFRPLELVRQVRVICHPPGLH
jgi:two-component system cell cycle sensor histidine kinase/response regulator CckA